MGACNIVLGDTAEPGFTKPGCPAGPKAPWAPRLKTPAAITATAAGTTAFPFLIYPPLSVRSFPTNAHFSLIPIPQIVYCVISAQSSSVSQSAFLGIDLGEGWQILHSEAVRARRDFPNQGIAVVGNHVEKPAAHVRQR